MKTSNINNLLRIKSRIDVYEKGLKIFSKNSVYKINREKLSSILSLVECCTINEQNENQSLAMYWRNFDILKPNETEVNLKNNFQKFIKNNLEM